MRKWLIYTIWSCEILGSLQINIAYPPPNQPVSAAAWNIKACRTVVPNLFDLATPFEILHARSTPATIYNCKDVRITTDKIRNTMVSLVGFTVFTFLCKTKQHVCYNPVVLHRGFTYHLGVRGAKAGGTKHQSLLGYTLWKFKPDFIEHSSWFSVVWRTIIHSLGLVRYTLWILYLACLHSKSAVA